MAQAFYSNVNNNIGGMYYIPVNDIVWINHIDENFWVTDSNGQKRTPPQFDGWRVLGRNESFKIGDVFVNPFGYNMDHHPIMVNNPNHNLANYTVNEGHLGLAIKDISNGFSVYRRIGPKKLERNKLYETPLPLP